MTSSFTCPAGQHATAGPAPGSWAPTGGCRVRSAFCSEGSGDGTAACPQRTAQFLNQNRTSVGARDGEE